MAYHEFQYPVPLNKARRLCERAIARLAPVWVNYSGTSTYQAPYTIDTTGHVVADDEPPVFAAPPEPDYMNGLTEAEKAQVRSVSAGDEERANYAATLRDWRQANG